MIKFPFVLRSKYEKLKDTLTVCQADLKNAQKNDGRDKKGRYKGSK